jgi:hypothetical protein
MTYDDKVALAYCVVGTIFLIVGVVFSIVVGK